MDTCSLYKLYSCLKYLVKPHLAETTTFYLPANLFFPLLKANDIANLRTFHGVSDGDLLSSN